MMPINKQVEKDRLNVLAYTAKIAKADIRLNEFDDLWFKVQQTKG